MKLTWHPPFSPRGLVGVALVLLLLSSAGLGAEGGALPEERRVYVIDPARSAVGFDGRSTLHGFGGRTSAVSGEIEVALARPEEAPRARIVAEAASLDTGNRKRDRDMRKTLAVEEHASIRFELGAFTLESSDPAAGVVKGVAKGRLEIRGVVRELELPVTLTLAAGELSVEGRAEILLSDHDIPIPRKFGFIKVKDEVEIWLDLRARAAGRSATSNAGTVPRSRRAPG